MANNRGILQFDDVHIIFRNFSGDPSQYNREGDRNFGLVISDPIVAQRMIDDGWNVKIRQPRVEGEDVFYWLAVKVKFSASSRPNAYLVSRGFMQELDEETIGCLDKVAIEKVNLDIRPYQWDVNGKTGTTAYLQGIKIWQKYNRFEIDETENTIQTDAPF